MIDIYALCFKASFHLNLNIHFNRYWFLTMGANDRFATIDFIRKEIPDFTPYHICYLLKCFHCWVFIN